jgi:hypothetical protein
LVIGPLNAAAALLSGAAGRFENPAFQASHFIEIVGQTVEADFGA